MVDVLFLLSRNPILVYFVSFSLEGGYKQAKIILKDKMSHTSDIVLIRSNLFVLFN